MAIKRDYTVDFASRSLTNPTSKSVKDYKEATGNLDQSFILMSKQKALLALFDTYTKYVIDNSQSNSIAKTKVLDVLNKVIEKENNGSENFINEIENIIEEQIYASSIKKVFINDMKIRLASITDLHTNFKVSAAMESYKPATMKDSKKEDILFQEAYVDDMFVNYLLPIMEECFPEDFIGKLL